MASAASPNASLPEAPSEKDARPPNKAPDRVAKKRTKTGCLTCRRRRIKCDELQPICQNCTKSKRMCQYKQFSFKDNLTLQRPVPMDPHQGAQGLDFMFAHSDAHFQGPGMSDQVPELHALQTNLPAPFAPLRPRPAGDQSFDWNNQYSHPAHDNSLYNPLFAESSLGDNLSPFDPELAASDGTEMLPYPPALFQSRSPFDLSYTAPPNAPAMPGPIDTTMGIGARTHGMISATSPGFGAETYPLSRQADYYRTSHLVSPQSATSPDTAAVYDGSMPPGSTFAYDSLDPHSFSATGGSDRRQSTVSANSMSAQRGFTMLSRAFNDGVYGSSTDRTGAYQDAPGLALTPEQANSISEVLQHAAIEAEDDDYFDVLTDDEEVDSKATLERMQQSDLQAMQSLYHQSGMLRQRGIHAFIYPGIMDRYRAERVASPLRNEATARVFAHFVSATGPMLSAFERVPRVNPTLVSASTLPVAHLSLWTFTLPMQALHSQGLLHAMLAMSSLHIAKLQGASITPSYKHYSWSVKRVHKAVGKSEGRHEVAVLAATLLLAFYEVMTADLIKWIPHLCGARQLILELDFVGMAQQISSLKAERASFVQTQLFTEQSPESFIDVFPEIDAATIEVLTVRQWPLDPTDQVAAIPHLRRYSIPELSNFEVLQDLYWWYAKQDMIHSIISGDPLLMHYSHWTRCPPRAPLGRRGAVYGSFDHVVLLIGRICDFISRDVPRKIAWNEANGSPFPPAIFYGMGPSAAAYTPRAYADTANPSPMAPPANVEPGTQQAQDQAPDSPLQAQTDHAMAEWAALDAAYLTLERGLSVPGFTPLAEDEITHFNTPFGRVVHYPSFNLAVLHMFVQMGRLLLVRAHPSMPAAMTTAVGVAAAQTSARANLIGRIAAGVTPLLSAGESLSPQLAGTFTDCTLPLFLAGVQYRDAAQRYWTVTRLHEIEQRSGWASAGLCANGCEIAWEKAGEVGVGPPYVRLRTDLNPST